MITKTKEVIMKNKKFVVAEDLDYGKRALKFNDDKSVSFVKSANNATIFDTIEDAEQIIAKYMPDDDFGFGIFKVYKVFDASSGHRWAYSNQSYGILPIRRFNTDLILSEITDDFIDFSTTNIDKIDKKLRDQAYIFENRIAIKKYVFDQIGQLIDLHNRCDIKFASTFYLAQERKEKGCQGCVICDRINYYIKVLDLPAISKFYKYYIGNERGRFVPIRNKYKEGLESYNHKQLGELAELFKDFVALRKNECTLKEIGEFFGVSTQFINRAYDVLLDSEYHSILGRRKRASKNDPNHTRSKIDSCF